MQQDYGKQLIAAQTASTSNNKKNAATWGGEDWAFSMPKMGRILCQVSQKLPVNARDWCAAVDAVSELSCNVAQVV